MRDVLIGLLLMLALGEARAQQADFTRYPLLMNIPGWTTQPWPVGAGGCANSASIPLVPFIDNNCNTFNGNSLGILSRDPWISGGVTTVGGTASGAGSVTLTITYNSSPISCSTSYASGATAQQVANALISACQGSTTLQANKLFVWNVAPGPKVGVQPQRTAACLSGGYCVPAIAVSGGGNGITYALDYQPAATLDGGPNVTISRQISGSPMQAGDNVGNIFFSSGNSALTECCNTIVGGITAALLNATAGQTRSVMWLQTAHTDGANRVRFGVGHGLYSNDPTIGPPSGGVGGDMGPGTINVRGGYYVNGVAVGSGGGSGCTDGTYTPKLRGSTTTGSPSYYSTNAGVYTKCGYQVSVNFTLAVSALGGAAGYAQLHDFPFNADVVGSCAFQQMSGVTMGSGRTMLGAQIGPGGASATFVESGSGLSAQGLDVAAFTLGWVVVQGFCTYKATA